LKSTDAEFPAGEIRKAGYQVVWRGQRTWNGVAILSRGAEPLLTRDTLPGDPSDEQARYIEAAVYPKSWSAAFTCRMATRSLDRNLTTSLRGSSVFPAMRASSCARGCRPY